MQYQNFPPLEGETGLTSSAGNVVNYVGIFYDYGVYNWGYLSPRDVSNMGVICEIDNC